MISIIIKQAIEKKKFSSISAAAAKCGVSSELLRLTLSGKHIPKDRTLKIIAGKLGLNKSELLMAAHRERVPEEVQCFFLSPVRLETPSPENIAPFSADEYHYLGKLMSAREIEVMRKYRQVTAAAKKEIARYIDYFFKSERSATKQSSAKKKTASLSTPEPLAALPGA